MSLNAYKSETIEMCKHKGWLGPSIEQVWMYLSEEIGELVGSIRRQRNQFRDKKRIKIENEMGDVFSYLFQLADMLDIDLDAMWEAHRAKMVKKHYNYNNNGRVKYDMSHQKMYWNDAKGKMCKNIGFFKHGLDWYCNHHVPQNRYGLCDLSGCVVQSICFALWASISRSVYNEMDKTKKFLSCL